MKFRKKPVEVEVIQYLREVNIMAVQDFFGIDNGIILKYEPVSNEYFIKTLEGNMQLNSGDWIIRGVEGEYYPVKPSIFEKTYEPVIEVIGHGKSEDGADSITVKV